jgi:hypothetical protein
MRNHLGFFISLNTYMIELHFSYSFTLFGSKPKREIEKIDDYKILFYGVSDDKVELIVLCPTRDIAEKLKQFLAIAYEILPKKQLLK